MTGALERIHRAGVTRRAFVAAAAAGTASLALSGCNENRVERVQDEAWGKETATGTWKTSACWLTCHCGCKNMAYVVDGLVTRQKTDDAHEDTLELPQQRGCVKGRSLRQFVMGPDRVKYPMKRKHWEPGGGDVTLRGRDEWVRISWDEALDLTASELKRIKDTYGNEAFGNLELVPAPLLAAFGGYVSMWGQQSKGAWPLVANTIKGSFFSAANDRFSLPAAKLVVLWGFNPMWGAGGSNTYFLQQAREAGARIIIVDSWFSPSCQALGAEWVPCRPATDGALLAAIAYHMIENDLQDQAFLDTYCVGFDSDHLPVGNETSENFKDYILGAYDDTPKTPEWASRICGTAPDTIRTLAEAMATIKPMTLKAGQAPARNGNGDEFAHMLYTVGWMTGNVGKLGAEVSCADGSQGVQGGPSIVCEGMGTVDLFGIDNVGCTGPRGDYTLEKGLYDPNQYYGIPGAVWWQAIKDGQHVDFTRGTHPVNIKCLYKIGAGAQFNQNNDQTTAIEVMRTPGLIEFCVCSEIVMSPDAQYCDIVLPATSPWETAGGYTRTLNRETVVFAEQLIEPLFEARSDWHITIDLAERLGIDPSSFVYGNPDADGYTIAATSTILDPATGEDRPLVTVTQEHIDRYDLGMEPQEGVVSLDELIEHGGYQVERQAGDAFTYIAMEEFIADPAANPLKTESGKLEICSPALVRAFDVFHTTSVSAIPRYVPSVEGYEEAVANGDAADGDVSACTFQMISLHHVRQAHSASAEVKWLNELFANNALINDADAAALGLATGDTARIANPHGATLRRVQVSARVMPGVVLIGQGNWTRINEESGIDEGCNVNTLTGAHLAGQGQCQFNNVLVSIEAWSGGELAPDYLRPSVDINL